MPTKNQILFSKAELKELTKTQIQSFINTVNKQEIDKFILSIIKANDNNGLPIWRQLLQLLSPYQVSTINTNLIPLFTKNNLLLYAFSKKQMKALTTEQIKNFSYNKFSLLEKGIRKALKTINNQLTIEYDFYEFKFQIESLTPKQLKWFTSNQKAAFTKEQIQVFTKEQKKAFNKPSIQTRNQQLNSNFNVNNINAIFETESLPKTNNPIIPSW
ncbi:hypothetical protein [Spiroplasma endosymbiont of Dasysyrphus albostriatus]|uniref:hypothetical protein n=1 Tax=Spiroplasma endosymbiont of Dasysyrphus albostriatus TaxID=3066299 RepID=UPI0030D042B8